jgi:hypothetical protein
VASSLKQIFSRRLLASGVSVTGLLPAASITYEISLLSKTSKIAFLDSNDMDCNIRLCVCGNNQEKVESRTFTPAKYSKFSAFHFLNKCL